MEERFDYNNYVHKTVFGDVLLSGGKVSTIPTYFKFKCNIWFHNDILMKNHSDNDFIIGIQRPLPERCSAKLRSPMTKE